MRYYSNLATEMTLTATVNSSTSTLPLSSVSGLPASYPFTLVVDVGQGNEEVVNVIAVTGQNATVQRGSDGTASSAHDAGAKVRHMITGRDLAEPQAHIAATSSVHGTGSGDVVGTTTDQALTNKSINGSLNTLTNIPKSAIPSDTVYLAANQTLTNKTINGTTNSLSNVPKTALPASVVHVDDTQTLTAKSLDGASNTFTNIPKSALPTDTAYKTDDTPGSFLATAPGWTDAGSVLRRVNGIYYLDLWYTRSGAAITTTAAGGIVDVTVCTVTAHPATWKTAAALYGGSAGGFCYLSPAGVVALYHLASSTDLANGDTLRVSFVYPI